MLLYVMQEKKTKKQLAWPLLTDFYHSMAQTSKIIELEHLCHGPGCHPLNWAAQRATSSLASNASGDASFTTSLGILCQCLNTSSKKFLPPNI